MRWLVSKGYIIGSVDASSHVLCDSCRLAHGSKRPVDVEPLTGVQKIQKHGKTFPTVKRQLKSIKGEDLHPGDCISIDQYVSSNKGRLATGYERLLHI